MAASSPEVPRGVIVASWLAWVWGGVVALFGLIIYTLSFNVPDTVSVAEDLVGLLVLAILYFGSAYLLRKRPRIGRWLAVGLTGIICLAFASGPNVRAAPEFLVNLVILYLVLRNWGRLNQRAVPGVGA